jgi:hypothetical protein
MILEAPSRQIRAARETGNDLPHDKKIGFPRSRSHAIREETMAHSSLNFILPLATVILLIPPYLPRIDSPVESVFKEFSKSQNLNCHNNANAAVDSFDST